MVKQCELHRLGVIEYEQAWQLQDRYAAEISGGQRQPTLLLLEHPHTYTFGRSGHAENLLWNEAELQRRGVRVHWVDRGGDVTYHGPGQLIGYPLLPLLSEGRMQTSSEGQARLPQADYVGYVRRLEETLILALARLGLPSCQMPGLTGVWIQPEVFRQGSQPARQRQGPAKIAAIGVKVDVRGVSRHGFALNVNPDMGYWQGIIGCGLKDFAVTSLADFIQPVPDMAFVMDTVAAAFGDVFGYKMIES